MRSILLVVRPSLAAVLLSVVNDPYSINPTGEVRDNLVERVITEDDGTLKIKTLHNGYCKITQ